MKSSGEQATRVMNEPDIGFVARGRRPHPATVSYARHKVLTAARTVKGKVRFARITLTFEKDPSIERPASAEVTIDVDGRIIRAQAAARSPREAIDLVEMRLRRRLANHRRRRPRKATGGQERGRRR
jgi:ribosome-associated translation inhibitor RaiA